MKILPIVSLILSLLAAAAAPAAESFEGTCDVTFNGYSTLHDFEGTVSGVPLAVKLSDEQNGDRKLDATSDVEVKKMSTDNDSRDEKMFEMFNVASFAKIKVSVSGASYKKAKPERIKSKDKSGRDVETEKSGTLPVTLSIAGTAKTISATTGNYTDDGKGNHAFDLTFGVSLKDFGLKAPSVLLGAVSVKDNVDVKVRVKLRKK